MPDAAGDLRHGPAGSSHAALDGESTAKNNRRRCLKSVSEWGVSNRASRDREPRELAVTVCPWQSPAEAAELLRVLMLGTA